MTRPVPTPGVSRHRHISDEGLQRLERQLGRGTRISQPVLAQWIRCYGEAAKIVINKYGQLGAELNAVSINPNKQT